MADLLNDPEKRKRIKENLSNYFQGNGEEAQVNPLQGPGSPPPSINLSETPEDMDARRIAAMQQQNMDQAQMDPERAAKLEAVRENIRRFQEGKGRELMEAIKNSPGARKRY